MPNHWANYAGLGTSTLQSEFDTLQAEIDAISGGVPGPPGPQGDPGPTGPQGPQGNPGANGTDGTNGTNGLDGAQGIQGIQGIQGPQGDVGPQGPAGSDTWGSITGTLSSQTDLQTALDGKQVAGTYATGTGTASGTNTGDQTNISGNAATATKLAATKTINGTAFDGSANIDAVPTWKIGQGTRDISTASGAQNIAHGLGRTPKYVHLRFLLVFSASISMECNAYYDGTTQSGACVIWTEGTSTALTDNIYQSTAAAVGLSNSGAVNPFTGATKASGVITVDGTNIIITWTKSGSPTGIANFAWECT